MSASDPSRELRCVTWNIAAINNNPFEYYVTIEGDSGYEKLMLAVQEFIDKPGDKDVLVSEVFDSAMFATVKGAMMQLGWTGIDEVEAMWLGDFSQRRIITGFLKDKELGSKRLASMPDRFTNTINSADGGAVCRPTIINNYRREMPTLKAWFDQWYEFMFHTEVTVKNKKGEPQTTKVCALLQPIKKAKYPAVTEQEEAISLPLQMLCQGIFDAIMVHIMNTCAAAASVNWHELKMKLCDALVINKQANVIRILAEQPAYFNADVVFLQEVAGAFEEAFKAHPGLSGRFVLLTPKVVDHVRDQNSLILVAKTRLAEASAAEEVTLGGALASDVPVADGDVCAFKAPLALGGQVRPVLLASFHGDTAGLASTPIVNAVRQRALQDGLPVVFGLDANTHGREDPKGATKHINAFLTDLQEGPEPLSHSWAGSETSNWNTTFNARTYLQPQLNKAVRYDERHTSRSTDCNPKDFILFSGSTFEVAEPAGKDNTGNVQFQEGMDFPTLTFPSDHAIVSAGLRMSSAL